MKKKEAAFGGTIFIEFVAYPAKVKIKAQSQADACPEPFYLGTILTLGLLSEQSPILQDNINKLIRSNWKIKAEV